MLNPRSIYQGRFLRDVLVYRLVSLVAAVAKLVLFCFSSHSFFSFVFRLSFLILVPQASRPE